jgi:hypothetical protein
MANKQDIQKCNEAYGSLVWSESTHPGLFDTVTVGQTEQQARGKTEFTVVQVFGYWETEDNCGADVARVDVVNREEAEKATGHSFWFYSE